MTHFWCARARVCHCQAAELEAQYIHLIALQKANGNALLRALAAHFLGAPPNRFSLCGGCDCTGEWPLTPELCEVLRFDVKQHCPPLPMQLEPRTADTVHMPTSRASTDLH